MSVQDRADVLAVYAAALRVLGSRQRAALWFRVRNPLLGGLTPADLVRAGHARLLRAALARAILGP